ncbi:Aminotransferase-like mobile domain containing protein [Trema orientale]|uniref:Aminotransferase-like mobile domain containing protein n=1 Tax=Trema orientale TaxID=63057 RepID=A0A2P5B1S3_TREOI|nr:Aminotransferase-like mobile domain containing protein [Trema orientale]
MLLSFCFDMLQQILMALYGILRSERAPDESGKEIKIGPSYQRSISLSEIRVKKNFQIPVSLSKVEDVYSGDLRYSSSNNDGAIQHMQHFGPTFKARVLEEVSNEKDSDISHKVNDDFFPALYRMLVDKRSYANFNFRGRAQFLPCLIEWTESILRHNRCVLNNAGIYGAVAVSRYPFLLDPNVWRAFTELWGPLTNTFHHSSGEMGISLYDLKVIGGLPILGVPYEEFIPLNRKMVSGTLHCPIVAELLRIHAQICDHMNATKVTWDQWVEYFYRGVKVFEGIKGGSKPPRKICKVFDLRSLPLNVSKECMLAAFLSLWLSRFIFPYHGYDIRPETFYMASLMAQGVKVSLAPSVLGYIYRALSIPATSPQDSTHSFLPMHYVIGWLAEHFRELYSGWDSAIDLSYLSKYAGVPAEKRSLNGARRIFREEDYVIHRPYSFPAEEDSDFMDNDDLSDERFELLVSMRFSMLPVRVGKDLFVEPYYPNRFARQFGFDQGVPLSKLHLNFSRRARCGIDYVAESWALLLKRNTGIRFHIPRNTRMGQCTWWYSRWWVKSCTPYLGRSVKSIHLELTKQPYKEEEPKYVIKDIRHIYSTLEDVFDKCTPHVNEVAGDNYVNTGSDSDSTSEVNYKRRRVESLESNDISKVVVQPNPDSRVIPMEISDVGDKELLDYDGFGNQNISRFCDDSLLQEDNILPESAPEMSISSIINADVDNISKGYIVDMMEKVFCLLCSSKLPKNILDCQSEVTTYLNLINCICGSQQFDKPEFSWFASHINCILEAAKKSVIAASLVEDDANLDHPLIHDAIHRSEEHSAAMNTLSMDLSKAESMLENLKAKEADIIAAEIKAQQMRRDFEAEKKSAEENISRLENSLKEIQNVGKEIERSRIEAKVEKFYEVERAKAEVKFQGEELQKINALLTDFFKKD